MKDIPVVEPWTPNPTLAIHGGKPVREEPMPPRMALGDAEIKMLNQAVAYYRERNIDPGYQGAFEKLYTDAFVNMMNGGYADAVATGTASLCMWQSRHWICRRAAKCWYRRSPIPARSVPSFSTA